MYPVSSMQWWRSEVAKRCASAMCRPTTMTPDDPSLLNLDTDLLTKVFVYLGVCELGRLARR